jgi:hypothetical protein
MIEFTSQVRPSMILEMDVQMHQQDQAPLTPEMVYQFVMSGKAWAARHNGKVVAMAGCVKVWDGRAILWGLIGSDAGPVMSALYRRTKKELEGAQVDFPRVEAYAARNHEAAHRFLKLLGFTRESKSMRKFHNNHDYSLYAKVI